MSLRDHSRSATASSTLAAAAEGPALHVYPPASADASSSAAIPSPKSAVNSATFNEEHAVELPPVDSGMAAWSFVAASCLLDMFIWGGTFAYGTYLEFYLASGFPDITSSSVALSAVGTIALALLYLEMLAGIILVKRFPQHVRLLMWCSLAAYVIALVVASVAKETGVLIVFQGVIAGSAAGLIYSPIYVYLSEWFSARRALAGGTIFAGAGLGGFVFPLILNQLLPRVGARWTLRIMALMSLVLCGIAIPFIRPRLPIRAPAQRGVTERERIKKEGKIEPRFLWNPTFVAVALTVVAQGFLYSPILVYLPTYSASFTTPFNASMILALLNIASVPGQILTGALCDRIEYWQVMLGSALISIVAIFALLRVGDTFPKVAGFAVLLGLTAGGFTSTWFPASLDISSNAAKRPSPSQAAPLFGYLAIARGFASIVGPIVAGSLYTQTTVKEDGTWGRYGLSRFVILVGWMAVVTAVGAVVVQGTRRLRARETK